MRCRAVVSICNYLYHFHSFQGIRFAKKYDKSEELDETKRIYDAAEMNYTKPTRRYILCWSSIVSFYGLIIISMPIYDISHGRRNATNWPTLFKLAYVA